MFCPNDNTEMHQVQVSSHYGQPIFLDQCGKCGGIWFDQSELYRSRQGEAEKVESLDSTTLWSPSETENVDLKCPRDRAVLIKFSDKYFPQGIIVARCTLCDGFWLNRGEFTKYQKGRPDLQQVQVIRPDELQVQEKVARILEQYNAGKTNNVLGRVGHFLSTPLDEQTLQPLEPGKLSQGEQNAYKTIMNVLTSLLSFFAFR
jgi:Zn-finger nucleic acid-binding protein